MNANHFARLFRTACLLGALLFLAPSCASTVRIHSSSSENRIRDKTLTYTPVGSTYAQVQEFINSRLEHLGPPLYKNEPARRPHGPGSEKVGVRCIVVLAAESGFPGHEGTYLAWAFDENDRLIDVIVDKEQVSQ